MTTIPRILRPNSGLAVCRGIYRAEYTQDGRRLYRSMGTKDLTEARARRDAFYQELRAAGATVTTPPRAPDDDPDSMKYIYPRTGYAVVLPGGRYVGYFRTVDEAKAAKRAARMNVPVLARKPAPSDSDS